MSSSPQSQPSLPRAHMRLVVALLLACVYSVALAGCQLPVGPVTPEPYPTEVPALHLPGLTEVPGVVPLLKQMDMFSPYFLTTATLPEAAGAGTAGDVVGRARIILGSAGQVESAVLGSIALDGSDARIIASNVPCDPVSYASSLTRDGAWLACGGSSDAFIPTSLASSSDGARPTAFSSMPKNGVRVAAWAPDGERIALQQGCTIDLFRVATGRAAVRALARLTLPPIGAYTCFTYGMSWSPDGRTLALSVEEETGFTYYLLSLEHLPLGGAGIAEIEAAPSIAISQWQLTNAGTFYGQRFSPIWTADSSGLLLTDNVLNDHDQDIQRVVKVTPDGARTVIFQLPDQDRLVLCAVAATADPKRFILDICWPWLHYPTDGNSHSAPNPTEDAYDRLYVLTTS